MAALAGPANLGGGSMDFFTEKSMFLKHLKAPPAFSGCRKVLETRNRAARLFPA
jgi:hypothetical protein